MQTDSIYIKKSKYPTNILKLKSLKFWNLKYLYLKFKIPFQNIFFPAENLFRIENDLFMRFLSSTLSDLFLFTNMRV